MTQVRGYHFFLGTLLLAAFALQSEGNFLYFLADIQSALIFTLLIEAFLSLSIRTKQRYSKSFAMARSEATRQTSQL